MLHWFVWLVKTLTVNLQIALLFTMTAVQLQYCSSRMLNVIQHILKINSDKLRRAVFMKFMKKLCTHEFSKLSMKNYYKRPTDHGVTDVEPICPGGD